MWRLAKMDRAGEGWARDEASLRGWPLVLFKWSTWPAEQPVFQFCIFQNSSGGRPFALLTLTDLLCSQDSCLGLTSVPSTP